ncbi:phosphoenolpyruvate mutase [Amycolatopsis bartoniae]|uniref:phosphoenolpyruvate mutase n=1 Tax=Amycolatopsis bartoniae TaxID=941986 RepID=A0A8H9IWD1_9PSEU|nr:phosphoenolpyruvate mutase [Amycolatopsis bartoniae]
MWTNAVSNEFRRGRLRELLAAGRRLRLIEVHNPVSAIIAEYANALDQDSSRSLEFDGFWSSSLADSTSFGLPDIELLGPRKRLENIQDIFTVTTKPLVMDGDTGGPVEHFEYTVRDLERAGVSAVVIEDKTGLKRNSLLGTSVEQRSAPVAEFCEKIKRGKAAQTTRDFMIIARIESLILGQGMPEALHRANAYVDAGADGIMIHSREESPREVLEFAAEFRQVHPAVPLVSVPTTYNSVRAGELQEAGFDVVIYANHMMRAALRAMVEVSREILRHDRTAEVESRCLGIDAILSLPERGVAV